MEPFYTIVTAFQPGNCRSLHRAVEVRTARWLFFRPEEANTVTQGQVAQSFESRT